jgi:hypothetical protein
MTPVKLTDSIFDGVKFRRQVAVFPSIADHFSRLPPRDIQELAPFRHAFSLPIDFYKDIPSSISSLLSGGAPLTVFFGVVAVCLFSIYGMKPRRFTAHVSKEGGKIILPSVANFDAATAIDRILFIVLIVASAFHQLPRAIFGCANVAVRQFVGIATQEVCGGFFGKAPTTEGSSTYICCGSDSFVSALTGASPHGVVRRLHNYSLNDKKSAKAFSLQVEWFGHVITASPLRV